MTEPSTLNAPVVIRRPRYLFVALFSVWMVGFFGASHGCHTMDVLHRPGDVQSAVSHFSDVQLERQQELSIESTLAFRKTVTPLAVAQFLLGTLLTLTTGLTLLGRRRLRRIALQAMLAYALFLPIDYVQRRAERAYTIDALVADDILHPAGQLDAEHPRTELRATYWWAYRAAPMVQLLILALGAFALTRPRARAFFGVLPSSARPQEP
jgi:hypothetical protein